MSQAIFGRPEGSFVRGGTHISVYLIPVFERQLVVFNVQARAAEGSWLPWDVLPWQGNPYATASELGDDWCDGAVTDLRLVDSLSHQLPDDAWELALVFRATLTAKPPGDEHRTPVLVQAGALSPVGQFETVDLERWVAEPEPDSSPTPVAGNGLVF